ncbi:hypothetical protein GCM10009133_21910 [Cocleimonas flava]|uniref:DUF4185 domain-containing protein n=1 Tax=Cocleimonas flava TaxID=634765 RepID=A0A4R1EUF4_9GAMM|nr:hypothetical protein [Cocleimonas flava]TCJ82728.1 hypothetical protein EV695_3460 [Cocleimonas flava]
MSMFIKLLKLVFILGFSGFLMACGSSDSTEDLAEVEPITPVVEDSVTDPVEPTAPPVAGQILFEQDIAEDITQSTPTEINLPLGLQATLDIEYLGAFRALAGGDSSSDYAVGILGHNPDNNSLFMVGHSHHNSIAEFAIPDEFSLAEEASDILKADVLQEYVSILDKRDIGQQTNRIDGILFYKQNLLVTSEIWYDASGTNKDNLQVFSNPNDLASSAFKGMLQIQGGARSAGYMSKIPANLVSTLGSEYLVGWASNHSITSRYSQGPSLNLFDPQDAVDADIAVDNTVAVQPKMVFPFEDGKQIVADSNEYKLDISPIWGPVSKAKYGFIIPGTSLFMAVGSHGGIHSGIGYKITQDNGNLCGGPCTYEADDNYNYFWLFDVNDMLTAEDPWLVQPISYGKWSHPYDKAGKHNILGASYDDATSTLYMTLSNAGQVGTYDRPPLILAYKVKAN